MLPSASDALMPKIPMPIRPHLHGKKFDQETIRVMGLAYEMALVALRLGDRGDLLPEVPLFEDTFVYAAHFQPAAEPKVPPCPKNSHGGGATAPVDHVGRRR
jgi:hypothetical protein